MAYPNNCEQCGGCSECQAPLVAITPALTALGFTSTPNVPVPCATQFGLDDLDSCAVANNPSTPSWLKCLLNRKVSPLSSTIS